MADISIANPTSASSGCFMITAFLIVHWQLMTKMTLGRTGKCDLISHSCKYGVVISLVRRGIGGISEATLELDLIVKTSR